jgi:tRNA (adenine22-N1)-methyltransferase
MMRKISRRLEIIASMLMNGDVVVDVGTDHAYLLITLMEEHKFNRAVGVDVHQGPYEAAVENVDASGFKDSIEIRLGDGLGPVSSEEMDSVAIAGMGGYTICKILREYPGKTSRINQLVLQPQSSPDRVRELLLELGFGIVEERLLKEDGRLYVVISAMRGTGLKKSSWENLQIGPYLLENGSKYLVEYIGDMLHHKEFVLNSIRMAKIEELEKIKGLEDDLERLRKLKERYDN